jgi:hypothetical protein
MAKGLYLSLMIGPLVPVPVSADVLDALKSVEVTQSTEGKSGFQMTFSVSTHSPLFTVLLLAGGSVPPVIRVILSVTLNGSTEVLMDGLMTHHQITPGGEPGQSELTITGDDIRQIMNYQDFSGIPYPAVPVEGRVLLILAKYAALGIIPMVIPALFTDIDLPIERIPRQQGKDLTYIEQLADEVGYVFYTEPGPVPGTSVAYWGPEIRVGIPQPSLNINMDAHTNVESLSFKFLKDSRSLPIILVYNELTKVPIPIPIPSVSLLKPPLALVPPIPMEFDLVSDTGKLSMVKAALKGLAIASQSMDSVTADGSLDVLRYGHVLKPRRLVGVRGAGAAFDGLYYVKSVTSRIKRGEFKQSFELARDGLISTLPVVPV